MKYNPDKHHRRSIRLTNYDYTQPGWYFVTIVAQNREMLFGDITNNKMILNDFGRIVNYHWEKLPIHFNNINLDEFQIMPNHIHGIIQIVGAKHSLENDDVNIENCVGKLVGAKHSLENDDVKIKNFNGNASPLHSPKNDDEKIKNCDGAVRAKHSLENDDEKIKNCDGNASPLQDHKKTIRNKK
jgi:hypothetical protein